MARLTLQDSVNPEMITLARLSRGYTQSQLAELLRQEMQKPTLNQGWVSKAESGMVPVDDVMLHGLSRSLRYPPEFFYRADQVYGPGLGEFFHRKRQNVPARTLDRVHAVINIYRMNLGLLLQSTEVDPHRFPFLDIEVSDLDPAEMAQQLRALWKLPPGPIFSAVRAIEANGGIIIPFSFDTLDVDAISQYLDGLPPLFFVNADLWHVGDRLRFSLFHEVGHLVMHQFGLTNVSAVEDEANLFAGEMLMPERDIRHQLDGLTVGKLAALKQQWKVSMSALIMRARQLRTISERQERTLWTQLAKAGYTRKREPAELAISEAEPTLLRDLVAAHLGDLGYGIDDLSRLLTLHEAEFQTEYGLRQRRLRIIG
jgi:Zn-dependent peptidase ImmA (M78 family)/transcriptional regulator with XRE-family HTH domain